MPTTEARSYFDLHPHTSYSREISGELTPYGGILIYGYSPLSPVEVAITTARRLSHVAEQAGKGNVFLPVGDLLTPQGAWALLDEIRNLKQPEELLPFVPRIIPSFEHPVFYHDPFLKRKRRIHLYIIGVSPEIYGRIMGCNGELAKVVHTCDESKVFFYLAHPLVSINRIPFTREQFEHLIGLIAEGRKDKDLPVGIEVRSGKITARLARLTEQVLAVVRRECGFRFVRVGGSDAYDPSVATTYTTAPLSENSEELIHNLRIGNDVFPAGKHGTRAEFEKRVRGLAETKIPAELKEGLDRFSKSRLPPFLRGVVDYASRFAMTFPVFCRFALEDEQIRVLREAYELPLVGEEEAAELSAIEINSPFRSAPYIRRGPARELRPGVLFLADTPLETEEPHRREKRRHFSGVKSLLDELKKYAAGSETPITIGQPCHEALSGPYEVIRKDHLTVLKFRPSVELYFGDCPTDLPIELSVDMGLALTKAELLERSRVRMLFQKKCRRVQPFSPAHKMLRDLLKDGAIGPFKATVSIDCGPYAKLAYAEGRGNLDVPTFGIYTTNLADSTLHRVETVYKRLARDITHQPLAEPLSAHADEVLRHLLLPVASFVSEMQTEFLSAVDLLFAPPGNLEDLRQKGIKSKIKELGRGLNKDFFKPGRKGPGEEIRLVCAGRFYAENKPADLVTIIEEVPAEKRRSVFLDVVGDGDELPGVRSRLNSLLGSNARFHGAMLQQKVGDIMGRNDVAIVMGDYHTYGQVYREGMACGAIPVAKSCFAARGVITDYRGARTTGTGILYHDPKEAGREIVKLLDEAQLRKKLQTNCLERAKDFPSWSDVFDSQLFGPIDEVVRGYRKKNTLPGIIRLALQRGR